MNVHLCRNDQWCYWLHILLREKFSGIFSHFSDAYSIIFMLRAFFWQAVVIDEVDTFLFRPHLGLRAKYHAVCPSSSCANMIL